MLAKELNSLPQENTIIKSPVVIFASYVIYYCGRKDFKEANFKKEEIQALISLACQEKPVENQLCHLLNLLYEMRKRLPEINVDSVHNQIFNFEIICKYREIKGLIVNLSFIFSTAYPENKIIIPLNFLSSKEKSGDSEELSFYLLRLEQHFGFSNSDKEFFGKICNALSTYQSYFNNPKNEKKTCSINPSSKNETIQFSSENGFQLFYKKSIFDEFGLSTVEESFFILRAVLDTRSIELNSSLIFTVFICLCKHLSQESIGANKHLVNFKRMLKYLYDELPRLKFLHDDNFLPHYFFLMGLGKDIINSSNIKVCIEKFLFFWELESNRGKLPHDNIFSRFIDTLEIGEIASNPHYSYNLKDSINTQEIFKVIFSQQKSRFALSLIDFMSNKVLVIRTWENFAYFLCDVEVANNIIPSSDKQKKCIEEDINLIKEAHIDKLQFQYQICIERLCQNLEELQQSKDSASIEMQQFLRQFILKTFLRKFAQMNCIADYIETVLFLNKLRPKILYRARKEEIESFRIIISESIVNTILKVNACYQFVKPLNIAHAAEHVKMLKKGMTELQNLFPELESVKTQNPDELYRWVETRFKSELFTHRDRYYLLLGGKKPENVLSEEHSKNFNFFSQYVKNWRLKQNDQDFLKINKKQIKNFISKVESFENNSGKILRFDQLLEVFFFILPEFNTMIDNENLRPAIKQLFTEFVTICMLCFPDAGEKLKEKIQLQINFWFFGEPFLNSVNQFITYYNDKNNSTRKANSLKFFIISHNCLPIIKAIFDLQPGKLNNLLIENMTKYFIFFSLKKKFAAEGVKNLGVSTNVKYFYILDKKEGLVLNKTKESIKLYRQARIISRLKHRQFSDASALLKEIKMFYLAEIREAVLPNKSYIQDIFDAAFSKLPLPKLPKDITSAGIIFDTLFALSKTDRSNFEEKFAIYLINQISKFSCLQIAIQLLIEMRIAMSHISNHHKNDSEIPGINENNPEIIKVALYEHYSGMANFLIHYGLDFYKTLVNETLENNSKYLNSSSRDYLLGEFIENSFLKNKEKILDDEEFTFFEFLENKKTALGFSNSTVQLINQLKIEYQEVDITKKIKILDEYKDNLKTSIISNEFNFGNPGNSENQKFYQWRDETRKISKQIDTEKIRLEKLLKSADFSDSRKNGIENFDYFSEQIKNLQKEKERLVLKNQNVYESIQKRYQEFPEKYQKLSTFQRKFNHIKENFEKINLNEENKNSFSKIFSNLEELSHAIQTCFENKKIFEEMLINEGILRDFVIDPLKVRLWLEGIKVLLIKIEESVEKISCEFEKNFKLLFDQLKNQQTIYQNKIDQEDFKYKEARQDLSEAVKNNHVLLKQHQQNLIASEKVREKIATLKSDKAKIEKEIQRLNSKKINKEKIKNFDQNLAQLKIDKLIATLEADIVGLEKNIAAKKSKLYWTEYFLPFWKFFNFCGVFQKKIEKREKFQALQLTEIRTLNFLKEIQTKLANSQKFSNLADLKAIKLDATNPINIAIETPLKKIDEKLQKIDKLEKKITKLSADLDDLNQQLQAKQAVKSLLEKDQKELLLEKQKLSRYETEIFLLESKRTLNQADIKNLEAIQQAALTNIKNFKVVQKQCTDLGATLNLEMVPKVLYRGTFFAVLPEEEGLSKACLHDNLIGVVATF